MDADTIARDPVARTFSTWRKWLAHASSMAVAFSLIAGLVYAVQVANDDSWRPQALVLIGVALGALLFLTDFGFSSAFRRVAVEGDFSTFRAHALMLALGSLLMVPVIHMGSFLEHPIFGFETPVGVSLILGGLLFGIGMQMSGGCASGTLFLLGSGNLKFALTLATFVVGSTAGAAHIGFWRGLPAFAPWTVFATGAWPIALGLEVMVLGAAWRWLPSGSRLPAKLIVGAVGLALLNFATLLVAGHPWSETYGFALWGSKIAANVGFLPDTWAFWGDGSVLNSSVFRDVTSIMDFAIILGAMLAASGGRGFRIQSGGDWRSWLSAGVGGLMMGYGARLADGCNIGAYFSAIVGGSFSGYVWAVAAILGSSVGVMTRAMLAPAGRTPASLRPS